MSTRAPMIERLTSPRRLLLVFSVIACIGFLAQVRAVLTHEGNFYRGGEVPIGADFNAFYSAGRIVLRGDGSHLYDLDRQQTEQQRTLGRDDFDGFQPFAYPAFVAAPYALLARLPFLWAYIVQTVCMLLAISLAVQMLRRVSPTVRDRPVLVMLAIFTSQPLMAAVYGGQTVAFSFLCFAGCYSSLRRDQPGQAGLWLGFLLYKPQLAVPLLALLLWQRRWRVIAAAGSVGSGLALVGVAVAGQGWPQGFMNLAGGNFYVVEAHENGANMISLMGFAENFFGPKSIEAYGIAGSLGVLLFIPLILAWRNARPAGQQFPLQFGLAIAATLALSPHALFYEASLLILPIICLIDAWTRVDVDSHVIPSALTTATPSATPPVIPNPSHVIPSEVEESVLSHRVPWKGPRPRRAPHDVKAGRLSAQHRVILLCLFAFGYLWSFGGLIGFQPLAALPVVVGLLVWLGLPCNQRLTLGAVKSPHLPLSSWGESPNVQPGKRS
ncbi:MAG: glycosyltransferase family 87 protein [Thermomicrobiales bacterium]